MRADRYGVFSVCPVTRSERLVTVHRWAWLASLWAVQLNHVGVLFVHLVRPVRVPVRRRRLLARIGCRNAADFLAFLGCVAIVLGLGWAMCWPLAWS